MKSPIKSRLKDTLKQLQRMAGVSLERRVTHQDLSEWAGVKKRVIDEWMRGAVAPPAMTATFELLSKMSDDDVQKILEYWKGNDNQK